MSDTINRGLGVPARTDAPPARSQTDLCTVVLCTLGTSPGLRRAVTSVLDQHDVDLELVVVDNDPGSGATRRSLDGLEDARLRYVTEPRRGLSVARNTGVAAARGHVVVFTDDDCTADPGWLRAICGVLEAHPEAAAVTGRTLPDGPPNPIQELFEQFGSFNRGEDRRVWRYDRASTPSSPIFPYSAVYGSGNNMAVRTAALRRVGPFDEALGAGSPAAGGEDLDMFVRLMLAGQVLVYEPGALVWHTHRPDARTLAEQVRNYGSGLSAMITKHLLLDTASRLRIARRVGPGLQHLLRADSAKNARKSPSFPSHLTRLELVGLARGPWLYLRGRRHLRRGKAVA